MAVIKSQTFITQVSGPPPTQPPTSSPNRGGGGNVFVLRIKWFAYFQESHYDLLWGLATSNNIKELISEIFAPFLDNLPHPLPRCHGGWSGGWLAGWLLVAKNSLCEIYQQPGQFIHKNC